MAAGPGKGANTKGAKFERELAEKLAGCFPDITRSPTYRYPTPEIDKGDFVDCDGWFIEAKKHDVWRMPQWIQTILDKTRETKQRWALIVASNRSKLPGVYAVVPLDQFVELVNQARQQDKPGDPDSYPDLGGSDVDELIKTLEAARAAGT